MPMYSQARNSTSTTSGNAAADVCAVGANVRPLVMEWGIFLGAATASTFSLRRTTAVGTRTSPVALEPEDVSGPALTGVVLVDMAVAFSAEPTEASTRLRAIGLPATIGVGVIWTFPRGISLAQNNTTNSSVCIIHDATNAASHWHHAVVEV